jgi:hypothetical protein
MEAITRDSNSFINYPCPSMLLILSTFFVSRGVTGIKERETIYSTMDSVSPLVNVVQTFTIGKMT